MDKKELSDLFNKSIESERDYHASKVGWEKIHQQLDNDGANRRKKFLKVLPWTIAACLLGLNLLSIYNQNKTNDLIQDLLAQNNSVTLRNKNKIQVIHDTLFQQKIVYVKTIAEEKEEINTENIKINSPLSEKHKTNNYPLLQETSAKSEALNTIAANEITKEVLKLTEATNEISVREKDSTLNIATTISENVDDSIAGSLDKKEEKKIHQKLGQELGASVGTLFPHQGNVEVQIGFRGGLHHNLILSRNLQCESEISYNSLYFYSRQFENMIGIPHKTAPITGYTLSSAYTTLSSLNLQVGLKYLLPVKTKIKPYVGLAYGFRYVLPNVVIYNFKNGDNHEIKEEDSYPQRVFIWNNFIPSVGFINSSYNRWNWYICAQYFINNNVKVNSMPNYFGVNSGINIKI